MVIKATRAATCSHLAVTRVVTRAVTHAVTCAVTRAVTHAATRGHTYLVGESILVVHGGVGDGSWGLHELEEEA